LARYSKLNICPLIRYISVSEDKIKLSIREERVNTYHSKLRGF